MTPWVNRLLPGIVALLVVGEPVGLASPSPRNTAGTRSQGVARKRPVASPGGRSAKPGTRPSPRRSPSSVVTISDDPSQPLEAVWTRHLDQWFRQVRPAAGAFVALDPETGEVIALSDWSGRGPGKPRPAVRVDFPAASVFKIVTSAALIRSGKVSSSTSVCYHGGSSRLDPDHLTDSRRDRSCRTLRGAFAHSTNAVFGKLAVRHLAPRDLLEMAETLGFNQVLRVGGLETRPTASLPAGGLDLARMAAGFVRSNLSPLAGAVMAAVIASGGRWPSGVLRNGRPVEDRQVLPEDLCRELRGMMKATSSEGTGARFFAGLAAQPGGGAVAVKSGTLTSRDGSGLFDTWMVGFFPADRPRMAFAALMATQGPGPLRAGHLARFALQTWVTLQRLRRPES
ncbi:MAG TPA: penicillin-binding transpeptidase domain-containing protein [Myxococcota bacterium]|nr:penicillin-binding transpeptidase domain-containing protein [Myxococcota bacterium]HQK49633.1 penicillin-binding transpeptidase domain-containing protein [Myxococcota bacterium]